MTKVSIIPLDRKIQIGIVSEFWYALGKLNRSEIEILLKEILSPIEVIMLSKRLEILKLLTKKFKYKDIKRAIKVTEPTIAKISLVLQKSDEKINKVIDDLITDEKKRHNNYINSRKPRWIGKKVFHTMKYDKLKY